MNLIESFYLRNNFNLPGSIVGGLLFGMGMALAGTCGFGALVRLGSGSLRSLIVIVALGLAVLTTQRGLLGQFRQSYIEPLAMDFSWANGQSLGAIVSTLSGFNAHVPVSIVLIASLLFWVFRDQRYRLAQCHILAGIILAWIIHEAPGTPSLDSSSSSFPVANRSSDWASPSAIQSVFRRAAISRAAISRAASSSLPARPAQIRYRKRVGLSWLLEGSGVAFIRSN